MKPYLLDVNLLVALAWPSLVHHSVAQKWFSAKRKAGFRTCLLTQIGFVRICSNPKFTPDAVTPRDALAMLERITALREHKFWPADLGLGDAIAELEPIVGHRQIADAYLLALARARNGGSRHPGSRHSSIERRQTPWRRTDSRDADELTGVPTSHRNACVIIRHYL